jgi:glutaminyl-tRNA synthetase
MIVYSIFKNRGSEEDFIKYLNPNSLEVIMNCYAEQNLKSAEAGKQFQFERLGYFCLDAKDSTEDKIVFNRVVPLRDSWTKIAGGDRK